MDTPNDVKKRDFYEWIMNNNITIDVENLVKICAMFSIDNNSNEYKNAKRVDSKCDMTRLRELMSQEGFIFIEGQ